MDHLAVQPDLDAVVDPGFHPYRHGAGAADPSTQVANALVAAEFVGEGEHPGQVGPADGRQDAPGRLAGIALFRGEDGLEQLRRRLAGNAVRPGQQPADDEVLKLRGALQDLLSAFLDGLVTAAVRDPARRGHGRLAVGAQHRLRQLHGSQ